MSQTTPRCLACGSEHLSPPSSLRASSYGANVTFRYGSGFGRSEVTANLVARICGSCGYVMAFSDRAGMHQMHARWQELEGF